MDDKTILDLIKSIAEQGTQLKSVAETLAKVEERLTKLEVIKEQDIKQNEKIEQILTRLQQGTEHFDSIESRLTQLEQADGKKARDLQKQIVGIITATVTGAILGNINAILQCLGGK